MEIFIARNSSLDLDYKDCLKILGRKRLIIGAIRYAQ